ncbi:M14 family metallopeptidase [Sediminibacterium soli]|uniref:M14 family metallopeptidase n=1 Tax=Sediminibacterium soli TaxID=2698829 RepID=UPI00137997C8|nr:M14 metallopeptidase family protein [Sediminibacterium soli]NCI46327.1 peptidase [Sediminibacterium soli]
MRKISGALLLLFMAMASQAQNVPTPKEHFGFNIGDNYMLANYTQTEAYVKKVAAGSDRARYVDIGQTEEGRSQFMVVITSPENHKKLDRYKEISRTLAHAEGISEEQARAMAAEGKTIVWIDGGLHATEVVGAHQLIELIYQLTTRRDPETMRILDKVIILATHANPDGQELVSNWYMRNTVPEKRSTSQLPRLYEKYAGHDNNRDFFMMNLRESQNINRQLYIEWLPQIMYNHHQAGPAGSVVAGAPYRDPFNYVFDPIIITSLDAVGAAMSNRLNVEGKPGYTERNGSSFSTWYNGGLRTTTYFHNMVGLLTEIIGSPTPSDIPLVPSRLIPSGATPMPVIPQKWYFRQSIDYSISLNYAVLDFASRNSDELLYNMYKMGRNSIERGSRDYWTLSPKRIAEINQMHQADQQRNAANNRGITAAAGAGGAFGANTVPLRFYDSVFKNPALRDARGFILPADQPDLPTAVKFLNALIRTGVLVQKATAPFSVQGKTYPAGSYVVKTDQAFRPHVLDMFEPQDHPNDFQYPGGPPIPPYDAAGWTLAYTMGVQFDRIQEAFDGPFQRIPYGELQSAAPALSSGGAGYLLNAQSNSSFIAANDLLKEGVEVYRVQEALPGAGIGSFFVPASAKAKSIIGKAGTELGMQVASVTKKPAAMQKIAPSRIALWDVYGGSMPSGWVRFIMEQYHFPVDVVYAKDIDTGNLRSRYDVIIFVDGAIPPPPGGGNPQRGGFGGGFNAPNAADIPEEFRARIGRLSADKSVPELRKFLEAGGNVVTIGSSTNLAYHLNLPVSNALQEMVNGQLQRLPNEKYYIPGSILRVSIDPTDATAWGMNTEADVYFDASPVFNIAPDANAKGTVRPIAWFPNDKPLRSGWAWGQSYLKDGVAAFVAKVGQGRLYAFGPEITFRAQTHGTFKLLFNQLYAEAAGKK